MLQEKQKKFQENILYFFTDVICKIPHGSGNCEELSNWIVEFAKDRNLKASQDKNKNVIVLCPASKGCENAMPVVLQAHLDMVAVSDNDQFDMRKHAIEPIIEDGWMKANKTSLGADDGVGAAMMLAILDDDSIAHPELVCIFTVDEEIGCLGAESINLDGIPFCPNAVNLDWEDARICIGCAGAQKVTATKKLSFEDFTGDVIKVSISGLTGGHSALAINDGGVNAIKMVADALYSVSELPFRLASISGGPKMNAIPTDCTVELCIDHEYTEELIESLDDFLLSECFSARTTDPNMAGCAELLAENTTRRCISKEETKKVIEYIRALPTGVISMDPTLDDTIETSLNLGVITTEKDEITIEFLIRSSKDNETQRITTELGEISAKYGAATRVEFTLKAWEPESTPLLDLCVESHEEITGQKPEFVVTHGGLECGMLGEKLPGTQWISMGPTIFDPHTVNERVSIDSIIQKFLVLCYMLERLASE